VVHKNRFREIFILHQEHLDSSEGCITLFLLFICNFLLYTVDTIKQVSTHLSIRALCFIQSV